MRRRDVRCWHEFTARGTAAVPSAMPGTSAVPTRRLAGELVTLALTSDTNQGHEGYGSRRGLLPSKAHIRLGLHYRRWVPFAGERLGFRGV
jgi:hypothetical protein